MLLVVGLLACEGQTITIEQTTPDPEGTRGFSGPSGEGTPEPTATPRPRVTFLPMTDGAALTALYDATGGEGWSNSGEWLYNEDLGQWHGVTTDAAGRSPPWTSAATA